MGSQLAHGFPILKLLLQLLVLLAVCQAVQVLEVRDPEPSSSSVPPSLKALQWNLHTECFLPCSASAEPHCDAHYPYCQQNAAGWIRSLLADVDFAGLEQFAHPSFFDQIDSTQLGHIQHRCGGARGFGMYPFDLATMVFATSRWSVKEVNGKALEPIQGCMQKKNESSKENDYRAYIGQAFVHKETGFELIVVVAHFPHMTQRGHEAELKLLVTDLAELKQKANIQQVLLVADTNEIRSNDEVMRDLDPQTRHVVGGDLHLTCCHPYYWYQFDRIILSNVGPMDQQRTHLPFGNEYERYVPDWAVLNMHDPVVVKFQPSLPAKSQPPAKSEPPARGSSRHQATTSAVVASLVAAAMVTVA